MRSAPLATHVEQFLKTTMCAPVSQGYGLTETCGSSFIALPEAVRRAAPARSLAPCASMLLMHALARLCARAWHAAPLLDKHAQEQHCRLCRDSITASASKQRASGSNSRMKPVLCCSAVTADHQWPGQGKALVTF